jgi:hypothetical protein
MSPIKSFEWNPRSTSFAIVIAATSLLLSGCSGLVPTAVPAPIAGPAIRGNIHGGQQPISGAAIHLYAAGSTGYAAPNTDLLTSAVASATDGSFSITAKYTCTAGQQMYLVAIGGNPGAGANSNAALMAALGDCSTLTASRFISVNEVTTVGSVFALAPFMSGYAALGAPATNTAGLTRAFASVNKLINVAAGSAPGSALPTGATAPTAEIDTLADVIAACINSTGGAAGDGSPCGTLFSLATPTNGTVPTDTIGATLAIAQNPALNVTALFQLATPTAPFTPRLGSQPSDWTMSISYAAGGFSTPKSTTIDALGNIWVANSGNNTVTLLSQTGTPVMPPISGNGLNAPAAIAIDANGNAWVANRGASTVSTFTITGGTFAGSPFSGAGLSNPSAIAIDAPGNIWVVNSTNNSLSELAATGAPIQQLTSGVASPSAIAINPK